MPTLTSLLSRRDFVRGAAAVAAAGSITSAAAKPRPNILWITCEDIEPLLGCYGDRYAITPNLDALAREGVRYTQAFSPAPVCAPSRSCLITGVYATSLGSMHLRGYVPLPRGITCFTEYLRQAGYYCSNNEKQDYNFVAPPGAWDESSYTAHWRKRAPGQPFFSVFNLLTTHQGQIRYSKEKFEEINAGLALGERHDPSKAPLRPYFPDTPLVRLHIAELYTQITRMDKQVGAILRQLEGDGLAENTIVFFFSDHGTGIERGKRWLYDTGVHVPLILRFPRQYSGLAPARPGAVLDRMVNFVDIAPTVLGLAGVKPPSYMQGRDFLSAESPRRYDFAASSRVDEVLWCSRTVHTQRYQYIRNFMPHRPPMQADYYSEVGHIRRELRRLNAEGKLEGAQKLMLADREPVEELYDLQKDHYEVHNLADSTDHQKILDELRGKLHEWMVETRDTGLLPESEMIRRSGEGSPYEMTMDSKAFPVEHVLSAAELVGKGAAELPKLKALLSDSDSAVRYWAAVGLTALGAEGAPASEALSQALHDSSAAVRIAASEALCNLGREQEALPVLREALLDNNPYVQLEAATVFWYIGEEKARPGVEAMRNIMQHLSEPEYSEYEKEGGAQRAYVVWILNKIIHRADGKPYFWPNPQGDPEFPFQLPGATP